MAGKVDGYTARAAEGAVENQLKLHDPKRERHGGLQFAAGGELAEPKPGRYDTYS